MESNQDEGQSLGNHQQPDSFICGQCQQQFDAIITFLTHRVIHTKVNCNYLCELCEGECSSKASILEHYAVYHKVSVSDETNEEEPYRIIEVGETDGKIIAVVADPEAVNIDDDAEKVYNMLVRKKLPDTATDEYLRHKINYRFAMELVSIQGNKFSYGKTVFRCLFCSFQVNDVIMLSRHMFNSHKDFVNNLKVEKYERAFLEKNKRDDGDAYEGQLLSMVKYRTCHQLQSQQQQQQRRSSERSKHRGKRKLKPEVYPCQTCGKTFKRARLKRAHMETHRTEKNFLCDECGKAFKSRTRLAAHRRTHREKIFRCQQCEFQSKVNSAIQAHRQVHSQGCVLCHICGAAYTGRSTLAKHMSVHSMDRPYPCTFTGCTWRFKTEAMCKGHFRAHTTKGKFKCEICNYRFRHKHHLQRHLSSVHQEEILKHQQDTADMGIMPPSGGGNKVVPDQIEEEGAASDMQMIQVVLNQQVHQEVVSTNMQGLQVFKLFTI